MVNRQLNGPVIIPRNKLKITMTVLYLIIHSESVNADYQLTFNWYELFYKHCMVPYVRARVGLHMCLCMQVHDARVGAHACAFAGAGSRACVYMHV